MASKKVIVDSFSNYGEAIKQAKIKGKRSKKKHYTEFKNGRYLLYYYIDTITPNQNVTVSIKDLMKAFKGKY